MEWLSKRSPGGPLFLRAAGAHFYFFCGKRNGAAIFSVPIGEGPLLPAEADAPGGTGKSGELQGSGGM